VAPNRHVFTATRHAWVVVIGAIADAIVPAALDRMLTRHLRCIADPDDDTGRASSERRSLICMARAHGWIGIELERGMSVVQLGTLERRLMT
jgi:hypothetical protein